MASKSRLGKGLGALFPTLPGEEPVAEQPAMIAEDSSTPEATADITPAKKATAQQESKPAVPQTISSSKAVKKAAGKRASMPALDTITHPSDLFFGTEKPQTGKVAAPQQGGKSSASQTAHRTSVTVKDVSRETSQTASAAKTADTDKKDELKPVAGGYLAEGERRWRASQLAGLETIPAIVKTTADDDMLRDALLENLHRVALNPLEEAAAYQQMIEEFGLTQVQLSKSVSKSRPQIANTLRLLNLPASVQKRVAAGVLSSGHARALLGLSDPEEMDKLASRIIAEGLSVRSTEEIVAMKIASGEQPKKPKTSKTNPWVGSAIQQSLENHFDTKVSIKGSTKHGRIEIVFSSPEDMDRILQLLVPSQGDADSKWV